MTKEENKFFAFLVYFCGAIVIALLVCFVLGPRLVR
jgi:hypothetical protein